MDIVNLLTAAVLLLLVFLLALGYRFLARKNDFFLNKPIPSLPGPLLLGGTKSLMLFRCSFTDYVKSIYDRFPDDKVFGVMNTVLPVYVLRDPELIKTIAIKDFDHFMDHRPIFGSDHGDHPNLIACKSLFILTGQKWKTMRATLSPAFTGVKMRQMFELIVECSEALVAYYREQGSEGKEWDMKDVFSRFTNDVIATCAFGIKVDSTRDRESDFYQNVKEMTLFTKFSAQLRIAGFTFVPRLMNWFGIDIISQEHSNYFANIIRRTVSSREADGITRPDMIHLMMQSRKGTLKHQQEASDAQREGFAAVDESEVVRSEPAQVMTENEMIGQCLFFFLAGFDTVSTALTFLAYELAMNPDVQKKLSLEIEETNRSLSGKSINYESLAKLKYLDMVVSESLRLWPPAPAVDRLCVRDYQLDDGEGLRFTVEKGQGIWIPIHGIHRDPKYYPDPERFDPDRFGDDRKGSIRPGTYIPFGIGPRNCIGSRFALMELKCLVYYLLLNFGLVRTERTEVPPVLGKGYVTLMAVNGVPLKLVPK